MICQVLFGLRVFKDASFCKEEDLLVPTKHHLSTDDSEVVIA